MEYYDFAAGTIKRMDGRVRLCPYYFVQGGRSAPSGGILATVCPSDKKESSTVWSMGSWRQERFRMRWAGVL